LRGEKVTASSEPRLLILESSGQAGQVALAQGIRIIRLQRLREDRRHAQDLAPAVAESLRAEGWKTRELNGIIVNRGPGSFTGLRVGVMSAKILAFASSVPLVAADGFAAIALQAPKSARLLDVIADAQREQVYVQRFARTGSGEMRPIETLRVLSVSDWLAAQEESVWTTGPGLTKYISRLPPHRPSAEPRLWHPQPESLLQLGLPRLQSGQPDDPLIVEPLYFRTSAAEEKWAAGNQKREANPGQ
jgi:tRNA threonylcarbamoyladenosine biosynthesis protein TsaB